MTPKTIELKSGERIIAVVPEFCSGPGWANTPTWVYIVSNDGKLREECIQPEEQTPELRTLFAIGNVMCDSLIKAVPVKKIKKGEEK